MTEELFVNLPEENENKKLSKEQQELLSIVVEARHDLEDYENKLKETRSISDETEKKAMLEQLGKGIEDFSEELSEFQKKYSLVEGSKDLINLQNEVIALKEKYGLSDNGGEGKPDKEKGFFGKAIDSVLTRWKGLWNGVDKKDTAKKAAVGGALLVGGGILGSRIEKRREERKARKEAKKAEKEAKKAEKEAKRQERREKWKKGLTRGGILGVLGLGGYHIHKRIKDKEPSKKEG